MSSNSDFFRSDDLGSLAAQHALHLAGIEREWKSADGIMFGYESKGMGKETGGYEKIARDERMVLVGLVEEYDRTVCDPVVQLVGELLRRDMLVFSNQLLAAAHDPRREWSDEFGREGHLLHLQLCAAANRANEDQAPDPKVPDDPDWKPAAWFTRNTNVKAPRLRQATSAGRKVRRVRSQVIDGVKHYSVADARRHWPDDMLPK